MGATKPDRAKPDAEVVRVLMVCMGNICRSPTAEALLRTRVELEGLSRLVDIESAGTGAWHEGEGADARAAQTAASRGVDLSEHSARRVRDDDFDTFDFVVAMDSHNMDLLNSACPVHLHDRLSLLLEYAPQLGLSEVPDPYYGSGDGFARVFDLIDAGTAGLLKAIKKRMK